MKTRLNVPSLWSHQATSCARTLINKQGGGMVEGVVVRNLIVHSLKEAKPSWLVLTSLIEIKDPKLNAIKRLKKLKLCNTLL